MAFSFSGKTVVITGASSGIGAALAQELGLRGARLALAARRKGALEDVAQRLPNAIAIPTDVTHRAQVDHLLKTSLSTFGKVDVWVNNAGRGISKPPSQLTDEDVDAMVRDNLKSALYGMQAVLPHFKEQRAGLLVNISSVLSRMPVVPLRSAYSASKAALNSLSEALREELRASFPDIHIAVVLPGIVATEFGNNALGGGPDSRQLPGAQNVDEVARVIADGLQAGREDFYSRPGIVEQVREYFARLSGAPNQDRNPA